ncbi:hypothetical protein QBL02_02580 [Leucobacter sp. UT-8R-CII-1-4]|uniref:hypothetical protein n=1 Tax=Leucobacter sp. UT-8R-CII-1-4 TaxID=3040075 RepID=UPI0024A7CAF2|nr:hypothetical protein [Leucobacter sp. UT-8R-CII-1-4]MDI6022425.1 hypothetical protein [Leucobacter sp. UT-8R-CII-1-4]
MLTYHAGDSAAIGQELEQHGMQHLIFLQPSLRASATSNCSSHDSRHQKLSELNNQLSTIFAKKQIG